jgi:hypothetical protein
MPAEPCKQPLEKLICHACFGRRRGGCAASMQLNSHYHTKSESSPTPRFIPVRPTVRALLVSLPASEHAPKAKPGLR